MILMDTNVWIEFFKQNILYVEQVSELLINKAVVAYEPIFSELLYGVRTKKDKEMVLNYWDVLPKIPINKNAMLHAAEYANLNNFHNLGIGLMDALIIKATIDEKHIIWSIDKKINKIIDPKFIFQPG